ncbi:TetR/AcrR family transcriptional regulator [Pseudodesulfovibrio sp. zrk46]|uniref:TetR/AcrR family transcriptional regulator n=1 Tax=Pseudodesulfovibrio sp. zrk46 TaxID=2725288 RepID=UPI001449EDB0|nr:TetR/AcrR family transcriptional regulator [Pseudodesulfovibrio sp. zrk46]QJB57100.1 TetR/AcrR family transcriptional regulator [Pseudodesulfovibrio sp. zrk46]
MAEKKPRKRRSRTDLLEAGLTILAKHGERALTIDSLSKRLKVTKGSFYHHFGSRDEFSRQLLEYWAEMHTQQFIEVCEQADTVEDSYCTLDALAQEMDDDIEVAVRSWALRDPLAREYQEQVDRARMEYLRKLYRDMLGNDEQAELFSQLEYATFVGSRQIMPRPDKERIGEMIDLWTAMLKQFLKGEKR